MAEERDDEQSKETEGSSGQQPTSQQGQQPTNQQGQQPIAGEQGQQTGDLAPEKTQVMTGGQGATGQTQSGEGNSDQSGQGFVGSQGTESDEYLREGDSSTETLDRSDFANQGQGAKEGSNENTETGERQDSESDIEGSSDNS